LFNGTLQLAGYDPIVAQEFYATSIQYSKQIWFVTTQQSRLP